MRTSLLPSLSILLVTLVTPLLAEEAADPGYTVHEWGTFTSVQGADGVQMDWNPLIAPDLPKFVYDRNNSNAKGTPRFITVAGKTGTSSVQRMETPVIYFYTDRARTIDVSVQFPHGQVTEWYPLRTAAPATLANLGKEIKPALAWPGLKLLPVAAASAALPGDGTGSHYYAARATDAALVQVEAEGKTETEKFLFYRGVASMAAPLTVKTEDAGGGNVMLTNTGAETLRHLFLYQAWKGGGTWALVPELTPGESRHAQLVLPGNQTGAANWPQLRTTLRAALVQEGLYEKEAEAMVKTWEDSWFNEPGMRVLYTLPQSWADRELPLALTPPPTKVKRVMVARAEIIRPVFEQALLGLIERYIAAPAADRAAIVTETRALGLGRFLEPAMRRVMSVGEHNQVFFSLSYELLYAATAPNVPPAQTVTAR